MILNKEKIDLIKASKTKTIKVIKDKDKNKNKNMKENIYFQNILKNNSVKNLENLNPQIKNINENMKDIFASDESKKKALKFILGKYEKEKNNNQIKVTLTEPENNIILFKDPIKSIKERDNNNKKINFRNKLNKNFSEKEIFKSENDVNDDKNKNKIKYTKLEYDTNIGYKTTMNNFRKLSNEKGNNNPKKKDIPIENDYNYNNIYSSINYEKKNYTNYTKRDIKNTTPNQEKPNKTNNNNEFILNNKLYKVTKKLKIPKSIKTQKNPINALDDNKLKNKTLNGFYINKKPSTYSVYEDRNQLNKENLTYNLDYSDTQNFLLQENDKNYLNDLTNNNKIIDNNNKRDIIRNHYKKKKNNKIRVIDNANAIKEFNISFPDDESDNFLINNSNNDDLFNFRNLNNNRNKLYQYYTKYYYMRNIPPININQFNINTSNNNNSNSIQNYNENNFESNNKKMSNFNDENLTERNLKKNNTYYSNDIIDNKFDKFFRNKSINNERDLNIDKNDNNKKMLKVMIKKRPLNEIKIKNDSYKKFQNLKYIKEKDINKINTNKKNIFSNDINNIKNIKAQFNINKFNNINKKFIIYPTERISILNNSTINNIIDGNKIVEDLNENIIIIKKNKEKILNQINADENIEIINKKLLEEKFSINNTLVKFIPLNEDNLNDKNKILLKENEKLKNENELLNKKDKLKGELINKLDKEKQNLLEEIKKLNKEIISQKMINEKILKENEKIKEENIKISNSLNEMIKNDKINEEIYELENIGGINFNVDIESINDGQIEKIEEIKEIKNNQ